MTNVTTEMTSKALIAEHNKLAAKLGCKELTSWKKAKGLLVEAILKLEELETEAETEAEAEAEAEAEVESAEPSPVIPKRTIREASLELLCRIAYYENRDEKASEENRVEKDHPRARSVGLPYNMIVDQVREEFEGAQTSVACLRWYAVKVRTEDAGYENYTLPSRRPRAKAAGKKS